MESYEEYLSSILEYARDLKSKFIESHWNAKKGMVNDENFQDMQRMTLLNARLSSELMDIRKEKED